MTRCLELLLGGVFDYAGMFPPAALPMTQAAQQYQGHLIGPERWVTNRFVCQVGLLNDLIDHLPESPNSWNVSALGTGLKSLSGDLDLISAFEKKSGGRAFVESFEVKMGASISRSSLKSLSNAGFDEAFIEVPWSADMHSAMDSIASVEGIGVKARTGGLEAASIPSADSIAKFLQEAANLDLNVKCTAGLHHPIRAHSPSVGVKMHGFINVLIAGLLALEQDLSRGEIEGILLEEDPHAFFIDEEEAGWKDVLVASEAIEDFREQFLSIGSCSITEPMEDLAKLGWLDEKVVQ